MGVLPILYLSKRLSSEIRSASGYRTGFLPLQSRSAPNARGKVTALSMPAPRNDRRPRKEHSPLPDLVFIEELVYSNATAEPLLVPGPFVRRQRQRGVTRGGIPHEQRRHRASLVFVV